jgi:hypothetical protein
VDGASELLLRLADPSARGGLLDENALLALATVCYEIDPATVVGATTAIYDRVDVAVPIVPQASASARLMRTGDPLPWDVIATWDGGLAPTPGADLIWAGSLVLRAAGGDGTIDQVTATDQGLDGGGRDRISLALQMSAPPAPADAALVVLPVVVAFLVAGADAAPRDLLQATAVARRAATPYSLPAAPAGSPNRRTDRCVCWVLPATAFDDAGWPGATGTDPTEQRAARLAAARTWLATQGVAVITT